VNYIILFFIQKMLRIKILLKKQFNNLQIFNFARKTSPIKNNLFSKFSEEYEGQNKISKREQKEYEAQLEVIIS
jgi:hypothetical protein